MFFRGKKQDGGAPGSGGGPLSPNTEQANKVLLIMTAAFLLLIFLDVQARRRHAPTDGAGAGVGDRVTDTREERLDQVKRLVLEPVRKSAREIFGAAEKLKAESPGLEALDAFERESRRNAAKLRRAGAGALNPRNAAPASGSLELAERPLNLYFLRFQRGGRKAEMVRVRRLVSEKEHNPRRALELLRGGPLGEERGMLSALTGDIEIRELHLRAGTATVNLNGRVLNHGARVAAHAARQIRLTLLEFPEVRRVDIEVDGRPFQLDPRAEKVPVKDYR